VLDQVLLPRPFGQHRLHQLAGGVQLVIAREQDGTDLLLLVALGDEVAGDDFQPAVTLPDLLPQVGGAVALAIGRVAGTAVVALVERQEIGAGALQPGGHHHRAVADRKMHQRAAREVQQRFGKRLALRLGDAVETVLVHRRVDVLGEIGLELGGRHRNAVEEQHQVDDVVVVGAALAHHAQPVGGVAGLQIRVHGQRRLELRQFQGALEAQHVHADPQQFQRAAFVQGLAQAVQQHGLGCLAMSLADGFPSLRLGGLHPGDHIGRKQCARGVIALGIAFGIQPAMGAQVLADVGLELDFVMQCQVILPCFVVRTSGPVWVP